MPISVLIRGPRAQRSLILAALCAALLLPLYTLFDHLEDDRAAAIARTIGTLVRDESAMSQSYRLSQILEDLRVAGVISCARLTKSDHLHHDVTFYDSSVFRAECANHRTSRVSLSGLDGHTWTITLTPVIDVSFYILKWLTLAAALLVTVFIYVAVARVLLRERERRKSLNSKRQFLQELTEQVHHDVASPLSALKIIADRAPLDEATKSFLSEAVKRTEGIFAVLGQHRTAWEHVDLDREIEQIVREKRATFGENPAITVALKPMGAIVPKAEVQRLISNVLNNAKEAGATRAHVALLRCDGRPRIIFGDDGSVIPDTVIENVGFRGVTAGKLGGSGLGLFHAANLMQSIGGSLILSKCLDQKVTVTFPIE